MKTSTLFIFTKRLCQYGRFHTTKLKYDGQSTLRFGGCKTSRANRQNKATLTYKIVSSPFPRLRALSCQSSLARSEKWAPGAILRDRRRSASTSGSPGLVCSLQSRRAGFDSFAHSVRPTQNVLLLPPPRGGTLNKVLYGEAPPRSRSKLLPFYIPFLIEKVPFSYTFLPTE